MKHRLVLYPAHLIEVPGFLEKLFLPLSDDFNPKYPKPHSIAARCLSMLLKEKILTHPMFEQHTGSWRLAAIIFQLKAMGWPIMSVETPSPTQQSPSRYVSSYFLSGSVIKKVSEVRHE